MRASKGFDGFPSKETRNGAEFSDVRLAFCLLTLGAQASFPAAAWLRTFRAKYETGLVSVAPVVQSSSFTLLPIERRNLKVEL
jgi:hypothetical protein